MALLSWVNDGEQHGLWSVFAGVPAGWRLGSGEADRVADPDYIEQSRNDLRPQSLRERRAGAGLPIGKPSALGESHES
jgi:glycopeptidolipid biosynthesis protein